MRYLLLFSLAFLTIPLSGNDHILVEAIQIEGNRKTKKEIILREMDLTSGDTILLSQLHIRLEQNKKNILNTGLFTDVTLNIKNWDHQTNHITLVVSVRENWYLYPLPLVELADRNFNVWWEEQGRDINRINFGMDLYHLNLTGNKDRLKLGVLYGYKQKYEVEYHIPYLDKKQTTGITFNTYFSRRKEIAYRTVGNKLIFDRDDDQFQLYRFRTSLTLEYRKKIRSYHKVKVGYFQNRISRQVASELNSEYFLNGRQDQKLMALRYEYIFDSRDVRPYPMRGTRLSAVAEKEGFGIFDNRNALALSARLEQLLPINRRCSFSVILKGKTQLIRKRQPYNDYWAMGYGEDYLRGYELYVIDGLDYGYAQTTLKYELFHFNFNWGNWMPLRQMKIMPVRIFAIYYNDTAYVYDNQFADINPLGNEWMWGTGMGLDFVVYYDKILQFQLSRNHLGEYGLFLHNKIFF